MFIININVYNFYSEVRTTTNVSLRHVRTNNEYMNNDFRKNEFNSEVFYPNNKRSS